MKPGKRKKTIIRPYKDSTQNENYRVILHTITIVNILEKIWANNSAIYINVG